MKKLVLALALLPSLGFAQQSETVGTWQLGCVSDRMTDRTACILRHREPAERGLALEILDRGGRLVPAITGRDLSLENATRGLLAVTGSAQLRFDRNAVMELPCSLEGRSLICTPRAGDAVRAANELATAERVLVRMSGLGSNSSAASEPTELTLAQTTTALERLRRAQPAGTTPPAPTSEPGLDLRDLLGRMQQLLR